MGQERGHDGDAHAAADIVHQIEDAGRAAHFLGRDACHGQRHQWNEDKTEGDTLQDQSPENVPENRHED